MAKYTLEGQDSGLANTIHTLTVTDKEIESLAIIFESVGGNFPAGPANASVDVSYDTITFHNIDNAIALTAGQSKVVKNYLSTTLGAQLAVNPLQFRSIKITVPALGAAVNSKVTWSGKRKHY